MEYFESYWKRFIKKGKNTNDGLAFEDLIEELLTLMYEQKWVRTGKTHDGNRDFYLHREDEIYWAECKNYQKGIELKTLAPTLVMAQVCDANTILFFSRSEINDNAKRKITAYGYKSSKDIIFYDNKLLEQLIIKYNHQLSQKFQFGELLKTNDAISEHPISVSEFYFPSILSKMITTENDYVTYTQASIIHYNEPFSLLLVITNNSIEHCKIEISFDKNNEDYSCYEYFDKNISYDSLLIRDLELAPGQSIAFPLSLRTTVFRNNLFLPSFQVSFVKDNEKVTIWTSKKVNIQCEWVGSTKLLGDHYNMIIEKVEKILTENKEFSAMLLTGSSGTGKSRILNECCCPLIKKGYKILELNVTQNHSTGNLIKEIIYFLYEVPAELIMQIINERIDQMNNSELDIDTNNIIRVAKMIESLDSDLDTFTVQYKELLFEKISGKKIAIIVDNLQFASDTFQLFLKSYIDFSVNQCRTNSSIFITSINLDYITEESSKMIYAFQNSNISHFLDEYVDGFKDVNQGILFLRELVHIENEQFDSFFLEIIDKVSLNPFNLYQIIKLLEEDEIVKQLPHNQGYLLPTEASWKTLWKMPENIDGVLERRFSFITEHMDIDTFSLILSLCYLEEVIDESLVELFDIKSEDLCYLEDHQIIKHTEIGYVFVHDIIRKYFENNWKSQRLFCLQRIKTIDSIQAYGNIYRMYYLKNLEDINDILNQCETKKLAGIPVRLQSIFLETLFEQCVAFPDLQKDVKSWISVMNWICHAIRNVMGSLVALSYYNRVYSILDNKYDDFSFLCCYETRHLLHSHCDIYIQIHEREKAINYARRIINKLPKEPTQGQTLPDIGYDEIKDEYYVLKAIMYNRIFCAYNNAFPLNEIEYNRNEAITNSRLQIPLIKNEQKRNLIAYLNNSDDGYRYYGYRSQYRKLMKIWEKCLVDIPTLAPEKTMNYYRKQVQYHLIKSDAKGVKNYIKLGRDYLNSGEYAHDSLIFNTFFIMSEAINNLQHSPKKLYFYTEKLLEKLVKIQLLLKSNKMGDIYMLKGINGFYANDVKTVYQAFKKAYQSYYGEETSYYWIKRELIADNIITAYAILGIAESHYDISFLPYEIQKQILSFSQTNYCAKGIIRTKDKLFNLPLVV